MEAVTNLQPNTKYDNNLGTLTFGVHNLTSHDTDNLIGIKSSLSSSSSTSSTSSAAASSSSSSHNSIQGKHHSRHIKTDQTYKQLNGAQKMTKLNVNSLEENADDLMCPLCKKKLEEPKLLNCLHVFCKQCLIVEMHSHISESGDCNPSVINCPKCKQETMYMRGDNNLEELEDTLAGEKKKLKEERNKRLKLKKQKNAELKAILKEMEEEAAIKEAHHDKQMNKLKAKELELLQTIFVDLEEKKDEIQMQLMNKTLEEKEVISKINEMVTKIKLSSSLEINEFPQFDILDFHKKNDLIKQYEESLISIRIEYNENMCKLPEELIQCQEKRKLMESKIAAFDVEISTIEAKKQSDENYFRKIREESENLKLALSEEMNENVHGLTDLENKESPAIKEVDAFIIKLGQIEENQKRIKDDQIQEIKLVQESNVNTEKHFQEQLEILYD